MQYVYTQPAHSQATVQPQYAYIQPPQITQPTSKHPQVYLASSSHTPTQGQSWYPGASHHVTNQVYPASSSHTPTQGQSWYPDSGASHHVTNMS